MFDLDTMIGQVPYRKNNGQFPKGNTPANKGKKWDEWLPKEKQEKVKACLVHSGNKKIGGWNKKAIAAVKDGRVVFFESSIDAAQKTGIDARNIRHVCSKQRRKAGGLQWFYYYDEELIKYL